MAILQDTIAEQFGVRNPLSSVDESKCSQTKLERQEY